MRPVTAGLVCDGQQDVLAILYALNVAINDLELRWVDLVVG